MDARTWLYGIWVTVGAEGEYYRRDTFLTNPGFLDVFDLPHRHGDPETALDQPRAAVLRADVAHTLFGTTDVVGRTIDVKTYRNGNQPYTVTGVMSILAAPKWTKRARLSEKWPEVQTHSTEISQTRSAIPECVRSSCLART